MHWDLKRAGRHARLLRGEACPTHPPPTICGIHTVAPALTLPPRAAKPVTQRGVADAKRLTLLVCTQITYVILHGCGSQETLTLKQKLYGDTTRMCIVQFYMSLHQSFICCIFAFGVLQCLSSMS